MTIERSFSRRRGASLVELLVVISLLSTVLVFVGQMLIGLARVEQAALRDTFLEQRLADLAVQFRDDVHRAENAAVIEQGSKLELRGPRDRQATYAVSPSGLERVERTAGAVMRREAYRLPECRTEFHAGDSGVIELRVRRPLPHIAQTTSPTDSTVGFIVQAFPRRYLPSLGGME
jgi:type II secretory pathway component PulJ